MAYICLVLAVTAIASCGAASKLPTYMEACKRDNELNACALKSARNAFPHFVNGDANFHIPNLDPLHVEKAVIPGNNLDLEFTNANITGLKDLDLNDVQFNYKKQNIRVDLSIPKCTINSHYVIDGKIGPLPIKGDGEAVIDLDKVNLIYTTDYTLEKDNKCKERLKLKDPQFEYKVDGAHFNFTNLFYGDKALSDVTHKFMNDEWEVVVKEMAPPMLEIVTQVSSAILTNMANKVCYEDMFDD